MCTISRFGLCGAQDICEAIGQAPCLVQLDLRSNRLEGRWAPALAHALAVTCTLRMLNLSENRLGPDDALFLSEVRYCGLFHFASG